MLVANLRLKEANGESLMSRVGESETIRHGRIHTNPPTHTHTDSQTRTHTPEPTDMHAPFDEQLPEAPTVLPPRPLLASLPLRPDDACGPSATPIELCAERLLLLPSAAGGPILVAELWSDRLLLLKLTAPELCGDTARCFVVGDRARIR